MLDEDIRIDSFCHHCAEPITIEMRGGRATLVEPAETIVYLALRPTQWWEDIITTCSNTMVFFCLARASRRVRPRNLARRGGFADARPGARSWACRCTRRSSRSTTLGPAVTS